ncbi:hypothetical protein V8E53_015007 [Lactarius tabidus]
MVHHMTLAFQLLQTTSSERSSDTWARIYLWTVSVLQARYLGVGYLLNVHEGTHGIRTRIVYNSTPLTLGMTVSNESGYCADGEYFIRIENVVLVREVQTPNSLGERASSVSST